MKLLVTGRQVTVTDAIRQDIDRKVARLGRVLGESALRAQCVVARERGQFVVELTLAARGDHALHGVGRHASLPAAVSAAAEKVGRQAHRLSDRWKTRRKAGRQGRRAGAETAASLPVDGAGADRPARIIRSRNPPMRPMSIDDAVLALSAGDRPFLVFRHDASNAVAVLYRRPDGHFGLIEPEA
jgi:putative sigma-54 modulation protein